MRSPIILSHGADSGPDATKVSALAALAQARGWSTRRMDYREDDARGLAGSVAPRLARLGRAMDEAASPPILVGSSMGAFVSGLASRQRPVAGLFLLATPAGIPGCAEAFGVREHVPTLLVHGWRDEVCPLDGVRAFAARHALPLLVLDDDHRLGASLERIGGQFGLFLKDIVDSAGVEA